VRAEVDAGVQRALLQAENDGTCVLIYAKDRLFAGSAFVAVFGEICRLTVAPSARNAPIQIPVAHWVPCFPAAAGKHGQNLSDMLTPLSRREHGTPLR
jgi:hypothetical protein